MNMVQLKEQQQRQHKAAKELAPPKEVFGVSHRMEILGQTQDQPERHLGIPQEKLESVAGYKLFWDVATMKPTKMQ